MASKPIDPAWLLIVVASFVSLTERHAISQSFVRPIGGAPYQDWTIVNYVDLQPDGGLIDYRGGNYTYDGHDAIDFTLPHFVAMDQGIPVYAAAAGTVVASHDGEFDRCSRVNPCGNQPNFVVLDHGNGVFTHYLHLKKFSIQVGAGEIVTQGQQIAEVGSSGLSSDPHLHFSVYENNSMVETYQDPSRWWLDSALVPYAGDVVGSLDHGIVDHSPSVAELVDRPQDTPFFLQSDGSGQEAYLWSHLHGVDAGDSMDFYFYRPDGNQVAHWHWNAPQIRYGWWVAGIGLPAVPDLGLWRVDFQLNGSTLIDATFRVPAPGDANLDGAVDGSDFGIWNANKFTVADNGWLNADFDGNGVVDGSDFSIWNANKFTSVAGRQLVPEPGANLIVAVGVCMLITQVRSRKSQWQSHRRKLHRDRSLGRMPIGQF